MRRTLGEKSSHRQLRQRSRRRARTLSLPSLSGGPFHSLPAISDSGNRPAIAGSLSLLNLIAYEFIYPVFILRSRRRRPSRIVNGCGGSRARKDQQNPGRHAIARLAGSRERPAANRASADCDYYARRGSCIVGLEKCSAHVASDGPVITRPSACRGDATN